MNRYSYDELKVGMEESFSVEMTEDKMQKFYAITGDENPLHRDAAFASKHGFYDKVCYGMLTASFLSTLAGVYLPGEKSLIQSVETKFIRPVHVGNKLTVTGRVAELNDTVKQMVLKVNIINEKGDKVLRGTMKIGVLNE